MPTNDAAQNKKKAKTGKSKFNLKRQAQQLLESQSSKPIPKQSSSSWEICFVCFKMLLVEQRCKMNRGKIEFAEIHTLMISI